MGSCFLETAAHLFFYPATHADSFAGSLSGLLFLFDQFYKAMKTTIILAAFVLAATLSACGEDPFFEVEAPAALPLKEQLQSDEEYCFCRLAPGDFDPGMLEREQLQDQDEMDGPDGEPLLPGREAPLGLRLKEQLQNEPDRGLCEGCAP